MLYDALNGCEKRRWDFGLALAFQLKQAFPFHNRRQIESIEVWRSEKAHFDVAPHQNRSGTNLDNKAVIKDMKVLLRSAIAAFLHTGVQPMKTMSVENVEILIKSLKMRVDNWVNSDLRAKVIQLESLYEICIIQTQRFSFN